MPKSSSPKKSSNKKSPGGKNSPTKKNSPGRGKDAGPPMENAMQTEATCVCYLCLRLFKDPAAIQAHLVLMDHLPPYNPKEQHCRACNAIVYGKVSENHKCAVMKANYLRLISCSVTLDYGPPYRCLFCRSKPMGSRVELAMHLLCYHRPNKPPGRCGLCAFTYDEPPPLPPPQVPPLPANATEEQKINHAKEVKIAKEKQLCEASEQVTPGLDNLRLHVSHDHVPGYTLWNRRMILEDSSLRFPYSCPMCGWQIKSNYALHAHVICCHGNPLQIQNDLNMCAMCGFAAASPSGLNDHVLEGHVDLLKSMGNLWIRRELLMNVTDPATTCVYCWETFKHDFELQAHLLVAHATNNVLRCGWCKVDFTACGDPIIAFMIMQHHEHNHGRQLHEIALENEYTFEALKEPLPEIPIKEELINARLMLAGLLSDTQKSKKSPPKKSPKSKSPKSKSPKSNSKSSKGRK